MTAAVALAVFALLSIGAAGLFLVMLFHGRLRAAFQRRCVPDATAADLAFVRIVVCAALLLYVSTEELASQASLDIRWFTPPGIMGWFGREWFDWLLSSEIRLHALTWLVVAALALALLGCCTRVTVPLAAILYLVFAALLRSSGKGFHEGYLGVYVLIVLCFLPCGDRWSVDARWLRPLCRRFALRPGDTARGRTAAYGWGVYACYAAASIPYLQLGMSKLIGGGLFWFDGRSLRNYMLRDNLNLSDFEFDLALQFYDLPTILFTVAGFAALVIELTYVLVLAFPRLRRVLPAGVALLHLGIWLGQDVRFLDAMLIPAIFILPSRLLRGRWTHEPREANAAAGAEPVVHGPGWPARVLAWLRGPSIPIVLVAIVLVMSYTRYRRHLPWPWPVASWTMYARKATTTRVVNHRRFLALYADGRQAPISLEEAAGFLGKPYRADALVRRDRPAFLAECLRLLRERHDPHVVGVAWEARRWKYRKSSLDEHLARDWPYESYRVVAIEAPPAELRRPRFRVQNLISNGGFDRLGGRSGAPRSWKLDGSWTGLGVGVATDERAFLLASWPAAQSLSQTVQVPAAAGRATRSLHAQVVVRASAPGAWLELRVKQPGGKRAVVRAPAPGDGAWHLVEVSHTLASPAAEASASIILRAPPQADVFYDDARLVPVDAAP